MISEGEYFFHGSLDSFKSLQHASRFVTAVVLGAVQLRPRLYLALSNQFDLTLPTWAERSHAISTQCAGHSGIFEPDKNDIGQLRAFGELALLSISADVFSPRLWGVESIIDSSDSGTSVSINLPSDVHELKRRELSNLGYPSGR